MPDKAPHTRTRLTSSRSFLAALLLTLGVPLFFAGCNTTEGVGEDLEAAGEGLEDVSNDWD